MKIIMPGLIVLKNFKGLRKNNGGFGLTGIIVSLVIISVMVTAMLPYLSGINKLNQAKSAVNTANSLIKSEIQYQQASYSNYAEQNEAPSSGGDYFGTVSQMIQGMNILPAHNLQQFLPQGVSLSVVSYRGNGSCVDEGIGGNTVTECLKDEGDGQFELLTAGLGGSGTAAYIPMFESGIKGGVSGYSGGVLTTQVSVPFGFSAYPKIQGGSGGSGNTTNSTTIAQEGGGGGFTPPECSEWSPAGACVQYTFSNGVVTENLNGYYNNPGSVCTEVSPAGACVQWSR